MLATLTAVELAFAVSCVAAGLLTAIVAASRLHRWKGVELREAITIGVLLGTLVASTVFLAGGGFSGG
jgi:hypothetical protein